MADKEPVFPSLKAYRKAYRLSQKAAAKKFSVSQAEWCRIENGDRFPRAALARRLYEGTGVPIEVLIGLKRSA
jgi:transcriptional regulator with XRE-family HTH domain